MSSSPYTAQQRALLARHFSEVDPKDHADIYLVQNLPQEVAATLNGVYSRSPKSMRDNFLSRLEKGLEESGSSLDDWDLADSPTDHLSAVMNDKSGKFLKTYAIDHGHNSLREGSVVHLAVEQVTQLVTRFIQRERRCSFEESSTRYISFSKEGHWIDPAVQAAGGKVLAAYERILEATFGLYTEFTKELLAWLERERPLGDGEKRGPWLRALRAEAFDAARYLLTPALKTKWGMVADARTMSDIISELLSHPLEEFNVVGRGLLEQSSKVLPTLLAHARAQPDRVAYEATARDWAQRCADNLAPTATATTGTNETRLLGHDADLDARLLASAAFPHVQHSFEEILASMRALSTEQRGDAFDQLIATRGKHTALPEAFEGAAPFDFEVLLDFGAYRDIGRHRKGYQQQQPFTVQHGYCVPPLLEQVGVADRYHEVMAQVMDLQPVVAAAFPEAAAYVTPFAFRQRVRLVFDPRQVGYFVELRSGPEGHFSYRQVAIDMYREVQRVAPLFARTIRVQEGDAFLGRMQSEQTAEERRARRMKAAGDLAEGS